MIDYFYSFEFSVSDDRWNVDEVLAAIADENNQ